MISRLRSEYLKRKERNTRYSLRAFARDLDVSQTLLSLILNGKRSITPSFAAKTATLLNLTQNERKQWLDHTQKEPNFQSLKATALLKAKVLESEIFHTLAQWYHLAILDLTFLEDFRCDPSWIAMRLGISKVETMAAIERLFTLGLLKGTTNNFEKAHTNLRFNSKSSATATRVYYQQILDKAKEELSKSSQADYDSRLIQGLTLTFDPTEMKEAKAMINNFQECFAARFTAGKKKELYTIHTCFFPLSKNQNPGRKK